MPRNINVSGGFSAFEKFDVIVAGSGLAALSAAHAALEKRKQVAVFSAYALEESSSYKAKGGIAVPFSKKDSVGLHFNDTLKAGCGLNNEKAVMFIISKANERINELIGLGLEFDKTNGIDLGLEGSHSKNRILHIYGDETGRGLTEFMKKIISKHSNAHFFENHYLADLISDGKSCSGALFLDKGETKAFSADATIIATGGYASLFKYSSNSRNSLGSGLAAAKRSGAELSDLEFVQFHPTTARTKKGVTLITESVRGEGAKIVDEKGEKIIEGLLPRNIVAREIFARNSKGQKAFLDFSMLENDFISKRFPSFYKMLVEEKKLGEGRIEIMPAAHYCIGGINVSIEGRTNLQGLYSAGESACSGMHGADRLPSNSLLEALVLGYETGLNASEGKRGSGMIKEKKAKEARSLTGKQGIPPEEGIARINELMWERCGITRNSEGLKKGLAEINKIRARQEKEIKFSDLEFENAKQLALLVIECALAREESRGVHYRSDFPSENVKWLKHTII